MEPAQPLVTNDAVALGLLALILGLVFYTERSPHPAWQAFYRYVPGLLLCYFLPSLLNSFGIVDGHASKLYFVSSRYLLPACLVLLTLSVDFAAIAKLGYKAIAMFLTGTVGIVVGGPLAILLVGAVAPDIVGGQGSSAVWRGMTTVAGSWIGGGANQTAMKEVFQVDDALFSQMVAVDVLCASVWMAILLFMAGRAADLDRRMGADTSAIENLKLRVSRFHAEHGRITTLPDLIFISAIGFGFTGLAHAGAGIIAPWIDSHAPGLARLSLTSPFFWIVVIATTAGLVLSFTRARRLEGAGASRVGSAMLYILVASIGMRMDVGAVFDSPGLFAVGFVWIGIHAALLILVARLIKAPIFYLAVGSQANVGGAASAPVVASAFHPTLAPVGVLLAVLGYALGTYAAWVCGVMMAAVAP
ncbi:MAG: hypothetical protein AMJ59_05095 [Gammaproteobacteria bacterium SG8_31]|jgi:uncharacterized membrane protein|nr:MAG: hypothetical protein AMJ59_05095 [Gammaproteobacteria bacterium SG8_31]